MIKIKNTKVGIFSDIHIGLGQDSAVWHNNILEFARWVSDLYEKNDILDIIIPGDIFHNRNEISVSTLSVAKDFFKILKKFNIYISAGNHDCYYKDRADVNSISLLSEWENITLIDKNPEIIKIEPLNKIISLIPWGISVENIPSSDICIGHFEINSFKMNTFKTCSHGIDPLELLNKSKFIISGHFHHKTLRHYEKGKILYVGSPYQQNFGDIGDERGVFILDLKTEEFEFFKNEISPIHLKINISDLLKNKVNSEYLKTNVPNNMISLVIDTNITTDKISLLSNKIQNLNPKFFRIDYVHTDINIQSNLEQMGDTINIVQNIEDFINNSEIEQKDEVLTYLNDLYNKLAV